MKGGVSLNDRKLGARVRSKALVEIMKVLEGEDSDFKKQILLKLAGTVLPRLNEHSGNDGEPIQISLINYGDHASTSIQAETVPVAILTGDGQREKESNSGVASA